MALCLQWVRHAVPPIDPVGKQEKLTFPWLAVVEHGHGVAADYDQFLLLRRVKP